MKTLVTPRQVVDLAFADGGYLPADTISEADIAAAETRFLLPVTGAALWQVLIAGKYPSLSEDYAAATAAFAVRLSVQPALDIRAGAGGTTVPQSSCFRPPSQEQLAAARRSLRTRFSTLLAALSTHLDEHADDYPEYDPEQNVLHRVLIAGGIVLK